MSLLYHDHMGCIEMKQGTLLECMSLHLCLNKEYIQGKDANLISIDQKACRLLLDPIELQYCISFGLCHGGFLCQFRTLPLSQLEILSKVGGNLCFSSSR